MSAPFNEFGPFAVGEVCRIVSARNFPELLGAEVTITSTKKLTRNVMDGDTYLAYDTDLRHLGIMVAVPEAQLRRRKPPQADTNERMYVQMWRDMAGKAPQRVGETA